MFARSWRPFMGPYCVSFPPFVAFILGFFPHREVGDFCCAADFLVFLFHRFCPGNWNQCHPALQLRFVPERRQRACNPLPGLIKTPQICLTTPRPFLFFSFLTPFPPKFPLENFLLSLRISLEARGDVFFRRFRV